MGMITPLIWEKVGIVMDYAGDGWDLLRRFFSGCFSGCLNAHHRQPETVCGECEPSQTAHPFPCLANNDKVTPFQIHSTTALLG